MRSLRVEVVRDNEEVVPVGHELARERLPAGDWGDGSAPESLGSVSIPFSATHAYAAAGDYEATVTVTDDDCPIRAVPTEWR